MKSSTPLGALMRIHKNQGFHEVVAGLIEQGSIGLIVGPSKSKKSMLGYNLAFALVSGGEFLGCKTFGPLDQSAEFHKRKLDAHQVLYVDLELRQLAIAKRAGMMLDHYSIDPNKIEFLGYDSFEGMDFFDSKTNTSNPEFWAGLKREVQRTKSTTIIFDCLYYVSPDENDNATMTSALKGFKSIADELGVSVVVVHHTGKGRIDYSEPFQIARGASSIGGFFEWVLAIEPKSPESALIHHGSRNLRAAEPIRAVFDSSCLVWKSETQETSDDYLGRVFKDCNDSGIILADEFYSKAKKILGFSRAQADKTIETSKNFERVKGCRGQKAAVRKLVGRELTA